MYAQKQTSSCAVLRVKIKKCEWEEVVCSNKARLVGDHIREIANNSGIKFKKALASTCARNGEWPVEGVGGLDL